MCRTEPERRRTAAAAGGGDAGKSLASQAVRVISLNASTTHASQSSGRTDVSWLDYRNRPGYRVPRCLAPCLFGDVVQTLHFHGIAHLRQTWIIKPKQKRPDMENPKSGEKFPRSVGRWQNGSADIIPTDTT